MTRQQLGTRPSLAPHARPSGAAARTCSGTPARRARFATPVSVVAAMRSPRARLAALLCAALLRACSSVQVHAPSFGAKPCSRVAPCFHVVPHSHLDPGWRLTVDQYYPSVAGIFRGVLSALCEAPARTFALGDAIFLVKWLRRTGDEPLPPASPCAALGGSATPTWRGAVRALARTGRLELDGGGWVSPDELLSPPDGVLHAFAAGLDALAAELLGVAPTVAWQIDPFGHGAGTVAVARALNFSAIVLNRVPYRLRARLRQRAQLDFLWAASPHDRAPLLASVLYAHYAPPRGLDVCRDTASASAQEATSRLAAPQLRADLRKRAAAASTGHVLLLIGDDFRYQHNAAAAFGSLDAIVAASAADHDAPRLAYSTPSAYFAAVRASGTQLVVRDGTFAPYADAPYANENTWTGAYAARPALKNAAWAASAAAHAAIAAAALARAPSAVLRTAADAEEGAALILHHDAITGTCAPHVAADYMSIAAASRAASRAAVRLALERLLQCETDAGGEHALSDFFVGVFNPLGWRADAVVALQLPSHAPPGRPLLLLRDARRGGALLTCQLDGERDEGGGMLTARFRIGVPPLGAVRIDASWLADDSADAPFACAVPRVETTENDVVTLAGGDSASLVTLRSRRGVFEVHAAFVTVRIAARRYVYLPDDDLFGSGPYVTRSLLVSGVYLWAGLGCGGLAGLLLAALARCWRRRGARRGKAVKPPQRRRFRFELGASCRWACGGVCFAVAIVVALAQNWTLLSDAALQALLTHGLAAGMPLGIAAAGAAARAASVPTHAAEFIVGGAVGVPFWLLVAPSWHSRVVPSVESSVAQTSHGAVSSTCTLSLGDNASLTVVKSHAAPLAPLLLQMRGAAAADTELVIRISAYGRSNATPPHWDDGVQGKPFVRAPLRSAPASAVPLAGFLVLPGDGAAALLPLRPTSAAPLGGAAELSVARSVTSDDGRGLGPVEAGRDDDPRARLDLALVPRATPAELRAAHRAMLHAPIAAVLHTRRCSAVVASPRLGAPLPADVHITMLRAPTVGDAALKLTLRHLGEPGADEAHSLAALATALGGSVAVMHPADGVTLHPGELVQLNWQPVWDEQEAPTGTVPAWSTADDACALAASECAA